MFGVWCLEFGVCLVFGVWCLVFGVWYSVFGVHQIRRSSCLLFGVYQIEGLLSKSGVIT